MHWKDKFEAVIGVIILIAFAGALYGWPDKLVATLIEWGTSIAIGVVLSGVSGELVEKVSGNLLKNITLTVPIAGFNFSITFFFIVTMIVRFALFG